MKVANLGMKWFLGVSSFLALAGAVQAAQYPEYKVVPTDGENCSISYQESKDDEPTGISQAALRKLRKSHRELVDGYKPVAQGSYYATNCDNARALARLLKNARVPKVERIPETLTCQAKNKIYRISVDGGKASLVVSKDTGTWIFGPSESDPSGAIKLNMTRKSQGCALRFTHNGAGLMGFDLCLAEGEKTGTLHVNGKAADMTCDTKHFHEKVAGAVPSAVRHGGKHKRHAAVTRKRHARKAARPSQEEVEQEAETSGTVDPDVDSVEGGSSSGRRSLQ